MVTAFTHAAVATAAGLAVPRDALPRRWVVAGALLAASPDLDAIGYWAGVPYGHLLGHRGLTHSVSFAAAAAGVLTWLAGRRARPDAPKPWALFSYLLFCLASHGVLDALTNGGLGIAFWSPFSNDRYFFPATPVEVAPIGVRAFFSEWGVRVMKSELQWVWLPALALATAARRLAARPPTTP